MAQEIHVTPKDRTNGPARTPPPADAEPSLATLLRQLADDSATLVKQEIGLARAEMTENFRHLAKHVALLAIGAVLLLMGGLVLTAALVAGLGDLLGDEYWLGALIVGVVYALIGGILFMSGKNKLQSDEIKPEATIETLKEDKRWVQAEAKQIKNDFS